MFRMRQRSTSLLISIMLSKGRIRLYIYSIVGNADGGKMMSEKEFEEFKNNVREARKNRLYVSFRNTEGTDCRTIGPAS